MQQKLFTSSLARYVHWTMSRSFAESMRKQNYFLILFLPPIVFHKIKQSLKTFLWEREGRYPEMWFSLPSIAPKLYGPLTKLEEATNTSDERKSYCLGNVYSLTFDRIEKPILAELNEKSVYHSIYCDERLFRAIGLKAVFLLTLLWRKEVPMQS